MHKLVKRRERGKKGDILVVVRMGRLKGLRIVGGLPDMLFAILLRSRIALFAFCIWISIFDAKLTPVLFYGHGNSIIFFLAAFHRVVDRIFFLLRKILLLADFLLTIS